MAQTLFAKLIASHFVGGSHAPGGEALLRVDQVMLGDGAASLVYLALEELGVDRVRTPLAACYVDQVTVSEDGKVADDHAFLLAASRRFGVRFSPAGHGIGPIVHLERFAAPGATLIGTHAQSPVLGAACMLALPTSAFDVALVLAGEPYAMPNPRVWRLRLMGSLPEWVSATDAALELLRRHGVRGRAGTVLEVTGEGVGALPIEERALFCAMASELGVVTTIFPADAVLADWLARRALTGSFAGSLAGDLTAWVGDDDAAVDFEDTLDLSALEPLIAKPQSPGNVVPVRFAEATPIGQVVIGGVGIAGARDLARVAAIVRGKTIHPGVSFDLNPPSRASLVALSEGGLLSTLLHAGVRVHEPAFGGLAGVSQAPQGGRPSLRTTPSNFPGVSGTKDDRVFLCSAATAAISALRGVVSRPSDAGADPLFDETTVLPHSSTSSGATSGFIEPLPQKAVDPDASPTSRPRPSAGPLPIIKGASIKPLPPVDRLPRSGELRVVLKLPDDVPLHEIAPEGIRGLSVGSNVAALGDLAFERIDITYVKRAKVAREQGGHVIVAGHNLGYGANRDHAAIALRQLGLRVVIAKSYGAHFRRSLVNAGVLPLTFVADADYYPIEPGELFVFEDLRSALANEPELTVRRKAQATFLTRSALTTREVSIVVAGGVPNWFQTTVASLPPPSRGGGGRVPVGSSS